jgi:hypothetical protein
LNKPSGSPVFSGWDRFAPVQLHGRSNSQTGPVDLRFTGPPKLTLERIEPETSRRSTLPGLKPIPPDQPK